MVKNTIATEYNCKQVWFYFNLGKFSKEFVVITGVIRLSTPIFKA